MYTLKDIQSHLFNRYGASVVGSVPDGFVFGYDGIPSGSIDICGDTYYLTSPKLARKVVALDKDWAKCIRQLTKRVICPVSLDDMYDSLSKLVPYVLSRGFGYIPKWVSSIDSEDRYRLFELANALHRGEIISALPAGLMEWFERARRDIEQNEQLRPKKEAFQDAFRRAIVVEEACFDSRLPVFLRHVEIDFDARSWTVGEPKLYDQIASIKEYPHVASSAKVTRSRYQDDVSNLKGFHLGDANFLHIRLSRPHLLTSVDAFLFPENPKLMPDL